MIEYILNRLAENSTWRGLILLLTACGVTVSPDQSEKIIALGLALVGAINVFKKHPLSPDAQKPVNGPIIGNLMFWVALAVLFTGCARFNTKQTDASYENGIQQRTITTKATAWTFGTSKSALANFKASQTDKTQGASVGALSQEASGTNAVEALKSLENILKLVK